MASPPPPPHPPIIEGKCTFHTLGGGLWLSCHGDLLAAEGSSPSSLATFTAPTFQLIDVVFEMRVSHFVFSFSVKLISDLVGKHLRKASMALSIRFAISVGNSLVL